MRASHTKSSDETRKQTELRPLDPIGTLSGLGRGPARPLVAERCGPSDTTSDEQNSMEGNALVATRSLLTQHPIDDGGLSSGGGT